MVIICGSMDDRRAVIMCHRRLHICLLLLSVLSGVWCKEKTVEVVIPDYQDATIPLDFKNVTGVDPPQAVSHGTRTASPGARATEAESSTARTERAEVEASTTEATGHDGGEQGVQGQISVAAEKKKLTLIDPVSVKILRGETNGILVTDGAQMKPILYFNYSNANAYSVDYHYARKFVFFSALDRIFRDEVVGRLSRVGPPKVVVATGVDGPVRLAVDWVGDRLYWMSEAHQTVEASDLGGSNRTLLFDNLGTIRFPNNIAVDPYSKHLFLVSNYSVFRADLDGANLMRLQLEGEEARGVKCLALDTRSRRVYFSGKEGHPEMGSPYIASCDYNGESCRDHPLPYKWNDIFSLDVFQDTLYFVHFSRRETDKLYSVDLNNPKLTPLRLQAAEPSSGGIWSIRVYHPGVQKNPKEKSCVGENKNQIRGA